MSGKVSIDLHTSHTIIILITYTICINAIIIADNCKTHIGSPSEERRKPVVEIVYRWQERTGDSWSAHHTTWYTDTVSYCNSVMFYSNTVGYKC